jgi:choline dehydrogenase
MINCRDGAMLLSLLLRPKSRGKILLRSVDPFDKPIIQPNYLSNAEAPN